VLCCAVLCCAVLCCAVLCCAVLCCAVLQPQSDDFDAAYEEDFTQYPICEGESEEYKSESASASDESFEDPDLTAANDDMYSSPRALDADRTLSPFGYADRQAARRSGDNRSGSGSGHPSRFEAPAAPAGHAVQPGVLLDVPHGGLAVAGSNAAAAAAAEAPVTPSTASSHLWSVLSAGNAAHQQQQQQQKGQRWGHGGPEDLPPSLATAGSSGSSGTAAAATAAAAAAARVGSQGVGGATVSSSQSGSNAGDAEEVFADAVAEAAAGVQAQQQAAVAGQQLEDHGSTAAGGLAGVWVVTTLFA
jgi:hypothetical protein